MNKENRPAADLFPEDKEDPVQPIPGSTPPPPISVDLTMDAGADVTVLLAQPSAESGDFYPRSLWFDSTSFQQIRVAIDDVEEAGHTTARLIAKYGMSVGGGFSHPGPSASEVAAAISGTGPRKTPSWVTLDPAAIGERLWHLFSIGGNGVLSPVVGGAHIQFRQNPAARPVTPGDLPEDATWGTILFDANAAAQAMIDAYTAGADVNAFFDRVAGNDLVTLATLLLPTYQPTGFNGHPCVQWGGANVPLLAPVNPTVGTGDYTYYFVLDNLDGGDAARIWGAGFGDSYQYSVYFNGSQIYAANNNAFGTPALYATDDWSMGDGNIYRYVKSSGNAQQYLFVNGVLKAQAAAAPQANNSGPVDFMNDLGGLGLTARAGRVVGYNKSHLSPTNFGAVADGLTAPEVILKAFWGTP